MGRVEVTSAHWKWVSADLRITGNGDGHVEAVPQLWTHGEIRVAVHVDDGMKTTVVEDATPSPGRSGHVLFVEVRDGPSVTARFNRLLGP